MTSSAVSPRLIREVSKLVNQVAGVQLESNQNMVHFRLSKRMLELGIHEDSEYLDHLRTHLEEETKTLVSLLTTHHTFFFREFSHFEYLEQVALPALIKQVRAQGRNEIKIWSAACSRGQEVYSMAMFMNVHLKRMAPEMTYSILGTDVDEQSVAIGANGVYRWNEIKEIPSVYLLNSWARGTGDIADFAKAKPVLKNNCRFKTSNLIELSNQGIGEKFDLIWCRNVFIYFKPEQIQSVTMKMLQSLEPHGYFFIGLSENLNHIDLPLKSVSPSVYQNKKFLDAQAPAAPASLGSTSAPVPGVKLNWGEKKLRVLCVDDSPTVLTLLKKIFDHNDFEVVGVAKHGLEAKEQWKKLNPDLLTLDLHMPEQNGIDYLKSNYGPSHPPVVVISSVSREDTVMGLKALELGAADFIEKPSLQNLTEKAEEIRMKAKMAYRLRQEQLLPKVSLEIDRSFTKLLSLKEPQKAALMLISSFQERQVLIDLSREMRDVRQAILFNGPEDSFPTFKAFVEEKLGRKTEPSLADWEKSTQGIFIARVSELKGIEGLSLPIKVIGNLTEVTDNDYARLFEYTRTPLVQREWNDKSQASQRLRSRARFFVPLTSMTYHLRQLLAEQEKK
jgi:chemotaxis protein methyltransferase CheR